MPFHLARSAASNPTMKRARVCDRVTEWLSVPGVLMIRRALLLVLYDLRVRRVIRWAMSDKAVRAEVRQGRERAAVRLGRWTSWTEGRAGVEEFWWAGRRAGGRGRAGRVGSGRGGDYDDTVSKSSQSGRGGWTYWLDVGIERGSNQRASALPPKRLDSRRSLQIRSTRDAHRSGPPRPGLPQP